MALGGCARENRRDGRRSRALPSAEIRSQATVTTRVILLDRLWGRLSVAGLLLAGCAFDPRGSSSSESGGDAGGGPADARPPLDDGGGGDIDGSAPAPDAAAIAPVLLETLTIQADEGVAPVQSTVVLKNGSSYRLVASGVVVVRDDGWSGGADYYWQDDLPDVTRGDSSGGVDLGLAVNDTDGNANRSPDWGSYTDSHVYEATMAGNDSVLSAIFFDPNYDNGNSGALSLEIWGPPR